MRKIKIGVFAFTKASWLTPKIERMVDATVKNLRTLISMHLQKLHTDMIFHLLLTIRLEQLTGYVQSSTVRTS